MKKKSINSQKAIRLELARLISKGKISSKKVTEMAKVLAFSPYEIRRINVCTHGICCDFMIKGDIGEALGNLSNLNGARLKRAESFPWGIIDDSISHIRAAYQFDGVRSVGSLGNHADLVSGGVIVDSLDLQEF